MYKERKEDLSVYYYIAGLFENAPFVNVVDEYPMVELDSPTIAVENELIAVKPMELGNRKGYDVRTWYIHIFANNVSQRDDFAYLIKNEVQNGIPVYDYDEGFPPDVSPSQIGTLSWEEIHIKKYPVVTRSETSKTYYRAMVRLLCYNNQIS